MYRINARLIAVLVSTAIIQAGCIANMDSIHRLDQVPATDEPGHGTAIVVDAKQRIMLTQTYHVPSTRPGAPPGETELRVGGCAEPSPDALTALSANASGNISKSDVLALAASGGLNEQATSIGVRTNTTQLQRDMMYRGCEAYEIGATNDIAFMTSYRRQQNTMIAALAIEQLTGALKPNDVVVGSPAPANDSKGDESNQTANGTNTKGKGTATDPAPASTTAAPAATAAAAIAATVSAANGQHSTSTPPTTAAQQQGSTNKGNTNSPGTQMPPTQNQTDQGSAASDAQAKMYTAQVVDDIVYQAVNMSFARELCTSILESQKVLHETLQAADNDPLTKRCLGMLDASVTAANYEAAEVKQRGDEEAALGRLYDAEARNVDAQTKKGKASTVPPPTKPTGSVAAPPVAAGNSYPPALPRPVTLPYSEIIPGISWNNSPSSNLHNQAKLGQNSNAVTQQSCTQQHKTFTKDGNGKPMCK
jgi:hypothetical protein